MKLKIKRSVLKERVLQRLTLAVSIKNNALTTGIVSLMKGLWDIFLKAAKGAGTQATFDNTYTRQFNNIINRAIDLGGLAEALYERFLLKLLQVIQQKAGMSQQSPNVKTFKGQRDVSHPWKGRQVGGMARER